jgi:N-acetylmuramoyl-L-alanine amidase
MMKNRIFYVFVFTLIAFVSMGMNQASAAINGKAAGPLQLLTKADQAMNALFASPKQMNQRQNWLNCISKYQVIYEKSPQSEQAPLAMFHAGVLYRKLYKYSSREGDIDKALDLFGKLAEAHKDHQLADDAQYQRGEIYYREKNDPTQAYVEFLKLDVNFPSGDMKSKAKGIMDELSAKLGKKEQKKEETAAAPVNGFVAVKNIRSWSTPTYTRIVIDTDTPAKYTSGILKDEQTPGKPGRLYVDLEKSRVTSDIVPSIPIKHGLLQAAKAQQLSQDTVRVLLDIETIGDYKIFSLYDPFRIVIDVQAARNEEKEIKKEAIVPGSGAMPNPVAVTNSTPVTNPVTVTNSTPAANSVSAPNSAPTVSATPATNPVTEISPAPATNSTPNTGSPQSARTARHGIFKPGSPDQEVSLARQLGLNVKRIVIDPGHGGKDPGTQFDNGIQEKDITLDIAKRLAASLEKIIGCEVLLTRDKDVFVPLDERTAFANVNKADLFISIHVNAHKQKSVYGLETYFLNMATDENAVMVAARENATSEKNISDLQSILNDLMLNTKISESSKLAYKVQDGMMKGIKKTYKANKSLGVKQAPFYVLIGAEMPAILIETGFITNAVERKRIMSNSYKNLLADGIALGVNSYIKSIEQAYNTVR